MAIRANAGLISSEKMEGNPLPKEKANPEEKDSKTSSKKINAYNHLSKDV